MERILVDSGAVLAWLDPGDEHHDEARGAAEALAALRAELFQTQFLRAETHALLLARLGAHAARSWLRTARLPVLYATEADEAEATALVLGQKDKGFSLCEAISFALMRRMGVRTAFAFDKHFRQWGRVRMIP